MIRALAILALGLSLSTQGFATDLSNVFQRVKLATVVIHTRESLKKTTAKGLVTTSSQGLGSGVVINPQGDILTAAHVVNLADDVVVQFANGKTYDAQVVSSMPMADIALLRLNDVPEDLKHVRLGDSDKLRPGNEVFVVGAPYGFNFTLSAGHYSGMRKMDDSVTEEPLEFLQTDAAINKGNSGGPMFTKNGRLVGIVSHIQSTSGGSEGLGFAASINMTHRLLLDRPPLWIGADYIPLDGPYAKALNVLEDEGFLVQRVAKGSWGDTAGLRGGTIPIKVEDMELLIGGDIILSVGGNNVYFSRAGMNRIVSYLDGILPGEEIEMAVLREGRVVMLKAPKPNF